MAYALQPTNPAINEAQNSERSLRLLAAQRQLYADAKTVHNTRLAIVIIAGISGAALAIYFPSARASIGFISALVIMIISVGGSAREKRKSKEAASIQEEFDTGIFLLPWNDFLADHPSKELVVEAAHRYTGEGLNDWYGDTDSLVRPLDILVCQRSNLAWGVSAHRQWAAVIMSTILVGIAGIFAFCSLLGLSFTDALLAVVAPLLSVFRELFEMWRSNMDSVRAKENIVSKISAVWESSLNRRRPPSVKKCREIQDHIFSIRQTNAVVPDWFYHAFRGRFEKVMHVSVADYVEQAREKGLA